MKRHSRVSAAVAMGLTLAVGLGGLAALGAFRARPLARMTLVELESKIGGSTDGAMWSAYGDKLIAAGKFPAAATAYEKAVALSPELIEARLGAGVALARAGSADGFFGYVSKLAVNYPKVAVDLMERAEVQTMKGDVRWGPMEMTAKAQAVD